ncbi:MAG: rhomboid family intrarane serine protease [Bacteroidetes bacterium]|nr:rhomboid family intrarane serine protease [Bacteroidota bacterium]
MHLTITTAIIIVNVLISFVAFQNENAFYKLCFWPTRVWHDKEYIRLLSGGFLHANWPHLIFNMVSLYFFGPAIEYYFATIAPGASSTLFIVFYISGVVVANIPDLYQQKDNEYFRAVGASGAVSAVIFASILFNPMNEVGLIFLPGRIPGFIFGILYLIYSAYMARRQADNIGHLAHFSGAIYGFAFPLLFQPGLFMDFLHQITRHQWL